MCTFDTLILLEFYSKVERNVEADIFLTEKWCNVFYSLLISELCIYLGLFYSTVLP